MLAKEDIESLWEYYSEADAKANEQEKEAVHKFASGLYYAGVVDEMVAAALNASLVGVLHGLAEMSRKDALPSHNKIDFKDQLAYARSLVGVLSAYTTYDWEETRMALDKFEKRLEELK
jgi:hypothetical protein